MTLLYQSPCFLEHETGSHPEGKVRLAHIQRQLSETGLDGRCNLPTWEPATLERLARVHNLDYVQAVKDFAAGGGGRLEADTVVSPKSFDVALQAVGAVCDAVQRVLAGEDSHALCLVRPPGHHAVRQSAMGFCLFNNVAVGARLATDELDLDRVLIVDWDVHHGNGTQDAFWTDGRAGFFSVHRWPFYPGTGDSSETGSGDGLGATFNLPLELGTPREEYLTRFTTELHRFADKIEPQLVLLSAGFDSHREDPVGSLGLEVEDFATLTRSVLEVANSHAGGKLVSLLEGGYNPPILAECVAVHLQELLEVGGC